jgi:hypothetical protein
MKKIITMAWAVIILLYSWLSAINCTPGPDSSNLISTENAVPIRPENNAKIRYNVPMSFALDDKNHLSLHNVKDEFKTPVCCTAVLLLKLLFTVRGQLLNKEQEERTVCFGIT